MKRGQAQFLMLMIAICIIIVALALVGPVRSFVVDARNATSGDTLGMNCILSNGTINDTIDDFNRAACITTDLMTPLFIGVLLGLAGMVIIAKVVFSR